MTQMTCFSMSSSVREGLGPGVDQTHQTISGRRRFYKEVSVEAVSTGYKVCLDGRELRTPGRKSMHFPNPNLAWLVAGDWDNQTDKKRGINPATMPFMTLASTAIDQIQVDREPARKTVLGYLPTDTLLFFTTEEDRILLKKQNKHFKPLLKWFKTDFGVSLPTAVGYVARVQHEERTVERISAFVDSLDHFELAMLQSCTMECKSILMAIAILCGRLDLSDATQISRMEEEFQVAIWGVVEGGHDMDRLNNKVSLGSVMTFLRLYNEGKCLSSNIPQI
jgi:ATP synthase mitochondrial F1 complex assembly factor 2